MSQTVKSIGSSTRIEGAKLTDRAFWEVTTSLGSMYDTARRHTTQRNVPDYIKLSRVRLRQTRRRLTGEKLFDPERCAEIACTSMLFARWL